VALFSLFFTGNYQRAASSSPQESWSARGAAGHKQPIQLSGNAITANP
jgi:hypothetical protein